MTRKPRPKTQAQLDKATDQRLQKTYARGLDWYNSQFEKQNGVCKICKRPPGTRRLHVDHDHSWKKVRIVSSKIEPNWDESSTLWVVSAIYNGTEYEIHREKKSLAVKEVKTQLLAASCRGLLCYTCNAGLQKFADTPERLRNAAIYLEEHQNA